MMSQDYEVEPTPEFPNRDAAIAEFRVCWQGFLWLDHPGRRRDMLSHLEELSEQITDDQDELFQFFSTVPGFQEFWYSHGERPAP